MNLFIRRLCNLLTVRSIVTLLLTIVFAVLALNGLVSGDVVVQLLLIIIGFYFGSQTEKDNINKNTITENNEKDTKG